MTQLMVPVTKKNKGFIIYNHLYSRPDTPFTIRQLRKELIAKYGLTVSLTDLEYIIRDYVNSGLLMSFITDKYITQMHNEED